MRRITGQPERLSLTFADSEFGEGCIVFAVQRYRSAERDRARTRDGADTIVAFSHPRDRLPVVETKYQLGSHRHLPPDAFDDSNHIDLLRAFGNRHEIDDGRGTAVGFELRFEHKRFVAILPPDLLDTALWRQQPASVGLVSEKRREACA